MIDFEEMRNQPSFARYEWTPYLPRHMRNEAHGLAPPVYILGWSGRGAQFQNLDEAAVHRIEYLHPYIQLPQLVESQVMISFLNIVWWCRW